MRWPLDGENQWLVWEGRQQLPISTSDFAVMTTDFFLARQEVNYPKKWTTLQSSDFLSWLDTSSDADFIADSVSNSPMPMNKSGRKWIGMSEGSEKARFEISFQQIQTRIKNGTLDKAVPVAFIESEGGLFWQEQLQLLRRLVLTPDPLRPYGCWEGGVGFMGATPEILFDLDGRQLRTMALAGTASMNRDPNHFLNDPKERAEHHFVVRNLLNVLQPLGAVELMGPQVLQLPTLQHLKTDICVQLRRDISWAELIQIIHPTAALGTFPREEWRWLESLPGQAARGPLGSPFGVSLHGKRMCALVGIRQFQWNPQRMRIGAGCGLVKESDLEREWKELLLKIESVQRNFGWS